ncbi:MAG: 16S rRNA (guanine(527)-N(7))-methyltransferase RsmG [Alphaproteobacteria bacterium]|nr:MAG: 16S rRNA (guanine(527)-N(7))-methyltransferase RsmG [Alphaproteobacteria bacterium]
MAPSPEELAAFDRYAELLSRWSDAINLVSRHSLGGIWTRHFLDSAWLLDLVDAQEGLWLDLGSGAGFPGLVLAILAQRRRPALRFALIEADQRKAAFLRTVSRETSCNMRVIAQRIERVPPMSARVITARALAPLDELLGLAAGHLAPDGVCLFPKGRNHAKEIEAAQRRWRFTCDVIPSRMDTDAAVLKIGEINRA